MDSERLNLRSHVAPAVLGLICLGFFALMVTGLVRWYTPVPFWDMWDAYLAGYLAFLDGNWKMLFAQTNEHRIWFSNILFYIDLTFFEGRSVFLIVANAVLAVAIWGTLSLVARHLLKDTPRLWPLVAIALGPLCFSWLQEQNLSWGFQSQFFVAYLFPLCAFASLAMSYSSARRGAWFIAAVAFGLASLGTMANGILVLPLLVVMVLAMPRPSWTRAAIIALIGAAAIAAWFQGYFFVERDRASLSQATTFVSTFLGLPFEVIFDSETVASVAGFAFIAAAAAFALLWLRARETTDPMVFALVVFLAYVGATCAIIAVGRAAIQPNAALVSRYATPSLIAWCALAILIAHAFRRAPFARPVVIGLAILMAWGLFPAQRRVLSDTGPEYVHRTWVGALALKMRVLDLPSIGQVFPTNTKANVDNVTYVANWAEKEGVSIMGDPTLAAAVANLGKKTADGFHDCLGAFDRAEEIADVGDYRRAVGWVLDPATQAVPQFAYIAVNDVIEGVVVAGYPRPDVAQAVGPRARKGGFTGFVRTSALSQGAEVKIACAG